LQYAKNNKGMKLMQIRLMRKLREKHIIPVSRLARLTTVIHQRLIEIELGDMPPMSLACYI